MAKARGEGVASAKLTTPKVIALRNARAAGVHLVELAASFGVSINTVKRIASGELWSHVGGPLSSPGEHIGNSARPQSLTAELVVALRTTYATGTRSLTELAAQYAVRRSTVWLTVTGKAWPNAGGPIHTPAPRAPRAMGLRRARRPRTAAPDGRFDRDRRRVLIERLAERR